MRRLPVPAVLVLATLTFAEGPAAETYEAELARSRTERNERLSAEYGWLSLAGLHWLEPGDNPVGSEPGLAVTLPARAPARLGTLRLEAGAVRLLPEPGATMTIEGTPVRGPRRIGTDHDETTDVVEVGRIRFHVIRRGERYGVRVKDPDHPGRTGFRGVPFYPVDPAYRVRARFEPFAEPRQVPVANVVGTQLDMFAPGRLVFRLRGEELELLPLVGAPGDESFFLMFRDETSGKETYGAGRYLNAVLEGDEVELDFNRAYNPPCAFTDFATCPLPPRGNRLAARVEAGEKKYRDP